MKKAILSLAALAVVMLAPRPGEAARGTWRTEMISMELKGSRADVSTWNLDGPYFLQGEEGERVALLLPAVQAAREAARREKIEFKLKANLDPDCEPEEISSRGYLRLGRMRGDDKREIQIHIPGAGDCGDIRGLAVLPTPEPPTKQAPPTKDGPD